MGKTFIKVQEFPKAFTRYEQRQQGRMSSFGMSCRVGLVGTVVSEERIASIIEVTRFGALDTSAVTSNRRTASPP
jgi:hypothetical protein